MNVGFEIFMPLEIVQISTAYSDVWILVYNDNSKTYNRQLFGVQKHY